MAIYGVDTKCYILALFIRDDGERFLLGSGYYEFKDNQKQFSANTIANDIVEVQGNDGYLLAGQVRRPGTQSFDGYVGDGTTSKEDVEQYRRDFFSFFRKNYFYKVVYVFPDGTAIQRKRGFLVDDPTVQELYQQYPEYHVALNFEDVNYYSYSENSEGEEIYAKSATIYLSTGSTTGGLVWDEVGAVNQGYAWGGETTASGTEFTVQNDLSLPAPITDARLNGNTYQQTYSGKNLITFGTGSITNGGTTVTNAGNTVTVTGTRTSSTNYMFFDSAIVPFDNTLPAGTYTLSIKNPVNKQLQLSLRNSSGATIGSLQIPVGSTSTTRTIGEEATGFRTAIYPLANGEQIDVTFDDIQLEAGSTATDFEQYVGGIPAPNPDYPQEVQTVTGEQVVTVSGNGGASQSHTINLGTTELCKIGEHQDYIYKDEGNWYVHKAVGKSELGTLTWAAGAGALTPDGTRLYRMTTNGLSGQYIGPAGNADRAIGYCSHYVPVAAGGNNQGTYYYEQGFSEAYQGTAIHIYDPNFNTSTSVADFKTWLANNNMVLYYALATPTDTQITDATLSSQLDALGSTKLMVGENNVLVSATGTNLPAELQVKYYTTVSFEGVGAVWEEGGGGGPTTVEVDSITEVYPIWTVHGPAVNPQLSVLATNTTISYSGTVTASQTLVIDMFNKTAKLNGTSVIGNVSGDWVSFNPGNNRVVYTTNNADALPSTIEWQEVVG